eukprot:327218-Chlamydomonas_euryale.AAC.1
MRAGPRVACCAALAEACDAVLLAHRSGNTWSRWQHDEWGPIRQMLPGQGSLHCPGQRVPGLG